MATNKPRLTITLEPHQYDLFRRLAALQGRPMSAVIVEILSSVDQPLMRLTALMEQAARAQEEAGPRFKAVAEKMERDILPAIEAISGQFDIFVGDAMGALAAGAEPANPRPCNHGGQVGGGAPLEQGAGPKKTQQRRGSKPKGRRV